MQKICNYCPRKCNIDREKNAGFCGVRELKVSRHLLHFWEEPIISGESGSGTIFFSGCNLKCIYCQNYDISQNMKGKITTISSLCDMMKELEDKGANNINFVTPSHYVNEIIEALDKYKPSIPICYNTSSYDSVESIKRLAGYVDIYLADYKYSNNAISKLLSRASDYVEVASSAILEMRSQVNNDIIENGLMKKGLIIRHLVLPNGVDNSKCVLNWILENLGTDTYISLMSQYTPYGLAKNIPPYDRKIKPLEYKIVTNYALKLGFFNAFVQDMESSNECYIPEFYGE